MLSKLKAAGLADSTLKGVSGRLKHLVKHSNLDDPEDVKDFIANKKVENSYKHDLAKAYNYYAVIHGLKWSKPNYRFERKVPKIPAGEVLKKIIGRAGRKYQVVFRLLAETGAMPIELHRVDVHRDIELEKGSITIQGSKGHLGRVVKLKPSLVAALRIYLTKYDGFPKTSTVGRTWRKYRNKTAKQVNDPTIKKIRLYDLRHYFGTMTYHKTKDIQEVISGHKKTATIWIPKKY